MQKKLHWPENVWSNLLQSALKDKAQETFAALSFDECSDYDAVKAATLKAYEVFQRRIVKNLETTKIW